jgi:hypothetical protein
VKIISSLEIENLEPSSRYRLQISAAASADSGEPPSASTWAEVTTLANISGLQLTSQLLTFNTLRLRQCHTSVTAKQGIYFTWGLQRDFVYLV